MTSRHRFREEELKHLEFLQTVIARHGNNSLLVKGWAITLSAAFIAVADHGPSWRTAVVSIWLATGFWLLDSYYLRQERLFRTLYERIAARPSPHLPPFTMDAERYGGHVAWRRVALSRTMIFPYGVLAVADTVMILFLT